MTTLRGASACTVKTFRDRTTVLTAFDGFRSQRSSRNMRNTQAQARGPQGLFHIAADILRPNQLLLCGIELTQSCRPAKPGGPLNGSAGQRFLDSLLRRAISAFHLRILAIARVVQARIGGVGFQVGIDSENQSFRKPASVGRSLELCKLLGLSDQSAICRRKREPYGSWTRLSSFSLRVSKTTVEIHGVACCHRKSRLA